MHIFREKLEHPCIMQKLLLFEDVKQKVSNHWLILSKSFSVALALSSKLKLESIKLLPLMHFSYILAINFLHLFQKLFRLSLL